MYILPHLYRPVCAAKMADEKVSVNGPESGITCYWTRPFFPLFFCGKKVTVAENNKKLNIMRKKNPNLHIWSRQRWDKMIACIA